MKGNKRESKKLSFKDYRYAIEAETIKNGFGAKFKRSVNSRLHFYFTY